MVKKFRKSLFIEIIALSLSQLSTGCSSWMASVKKEPLRTVYTLEEIQEMSGAKDEYKIKGIQYIDLGLPSGKLWSVGKDYEAWKEGAPYPSEADFRELYSKCDWRWVEVSGLNGYLITGPNDNSMFLPAYGMREYPPHPYVRDVSNRGYYWISEEAHDPLLPNSAKFFLIQSNTVSANLNPFDNASAKICELSYCYVTGKP